jgi:CheY-like chemotaxis protein
MGGKIGVKKNPDRGSTFWFEMNLEVSQAPKSQEPEFKRTFDENIGKNKRILLAEDNPVNQIITVRMLTKFGYRVDSVGNGKEVLEALTSVPYDLIIMDCQMPVMDGFEASKAIRKKESVKKSKRVPILAFTAGAMQADQDKCVESGMDGYISKPVKRDTLVQKIEGLLAHQEEVI